jgi:NAD(P)-dependent dehydrogenase (short-subunit alcohol dehydrogenase family)
MTESEYKDTKMYQNSKLCSLLYSRRLALDFSAEQKPVSVNIVSPGMVFTHITRYQKLMYLKYALLFIPLGPFIRTARQGSQTVLQCTMNSTLTQTGKYFRNCKESAFAPVAERPDWLNQVWTSTNRVIGISKNL